jgi:hypothetical protein
VAALGREGSSADVRLGDAGSGDSACRTDTMVPVLGGGSGGKGRRPRRARRWPWRRSGWRLGEEASRRGAWVVMARSLCGDSARGGFAD